VVKVRVNLYEYLSVVSGYQMGCCSDEEVERMKRKFLEKYGLTEEDLESMRKACFKGRFRILSS
jgi:hypothetical protein